MNRRALLGQAGGGPPDRACRVFDISQHVEYPRTEVQIYEEGSQRTPPSHGQETTARHRAAPACAQTDADLAPRTPAPGDLRSGEAAARAPGSGPPAV